MIKNYFKIAFRNLKRNKVYMTINVMGLALGVTCAILIFTIIKYHLSVDHFHANSDRIYRIVTEQHRDNISYTSGVPGPLGKALRDDYNYTEKISRIATFEDALITIKDNTGDKKFKEGPGIAFTEPEYFDIFNFPLLQGDKKTALTEPNTAIITEKVAKKYFGTTDAMNRVFKLDNKIDFKVSGILKDIPENTDQHCQVYASYSTLKQYNEWLAGDNSWGGIESAMNCYVLLRPNVNPAQVESVLPAYVKKFRPKSKNVHVYKLQPLSDVHFDARYDGVMQKKTLWILSLIGFFLVITACVNFINLATAQALNRSKEVGVRKVLGSKRSQLFWQFIAETTVITVLAVLIAIALSYIALPYVNSWFELNLHIDLLTDWRLMVFIPLLAIVVIFFAGSYPGLILSGFQPIAALKNKLTQRSAGGFNTRRSLIIVQFAISQVLIITVIVIAKQMNYSKNSDLGFTKDAIVMVPVASSPEKSKTLKTQLQKISGVQDVSMCFSPPSSSNNWNTAPIYDNHLEEESFRISVKSGDEDFVKTFGLHLIAGRNLYPSDSVSEFVVNETFVKKVNLKSPNDVLGKSLKIDGNLKGTIVGVVKDFHDQSFYADINALCITTHVGLYNSYAVKINLANTKPTLAAIEKTWVSMNPESLYDYEFVDKHIAAFYSSEDEMLKLIQLFSFIAIFIGCLGLYGLVSFMATQKTKEIGIRKVLGGSILNILWMFGKEFSRLILISFIIAAPVGFWLMNSWLQDFKFRIPINIWVFVSAVLVTVIVAALTVGYRSIRAAIANPIKSLRTE
ncbi:MAG: ABC transporter permease [Chitinophagaceae bacterium]